MRTFRLPYRPKPLAEVSNRFHLTPLIRAMTSPQDIFVLALTEKGVRLLHVFVNLPPTRIHVPDLPHDAEEVARRASIRERNQKGHLEGSEAAKFLLYKFARRVDQALLSVLAERAAPLVLAADEFGYRRLREMAKRQGRRMNLKKVYRLYREEGLAVRRRRGRKRAIGVREPLHQAQRPNQIWVLDFMSDMLETGRRFRVFNVEDQLTREGLAAEVDTSLPGPRVARALDRIVAERGKPEMIVSDNGTELTCNAMLKWAEDNGVAWH